MNNDIKKLRELFIKRMTIDSKTNDARRKEFNQAIFHFNEDGTSYAIWSEMDVDMVLRCFDDAVRDLLMGGQTDGRSGINAAD